MIAQTGLGRKIVHFNSVFSAYFIFLDIMKTGRNLKYDFSIDTVNLLGPKWFELIENLRHGRGSRQQVSASYWFCKMALGQPEQHSTLCVHVQLFVILLNFPQTLPPNKLTKLWILIKIDSVPMSYPELIPPIKMFVKMNFSKVYLTISSFLLDYHIFQLQFITDLMVKKSTTCTKV